MKKLVRLHSFGKKDKLLAIDQETIRFQDKTIRLNEVTAIIYQVSPMLFYRFTVGERYHIGLRTPSDELNIVLKSYLGIRNRYFADLCERIVAKIWDPVTDRLLEASMERLLAGGTMPVGHCQVSKEGIRFVQHHAIASTEQFIPWEDLLYEIKNDRLVLNNKSDYHIWTNLYFEDTWNIDVLIAILDWVTKENGLAQLQD